MKGASFTAMTVVAALRTILKEDKEKIVLSVSVFHQQ
jgi:hypothetical protein